MQGELLPAPKPTGRGGPRPNSGRKRRELGGDVKDAITGKKLMQDGEAVPILVLINNMRFYFKRAEALTDQLEKSEDFLQELLDPVNMAQFLRIDDPEKALAAQQMMLKQHKKLMDLLEKVTKYRDKAQESAIAAAPYCHPKLAALQVKVDTTDAGDSKQPMLDITPQMTAKEAIDSYINYLRNKDEQAAG